MTLACSSCSWRAAVRQQEQQEQQRGMESGSEAVRVEGGCSYGLLLLQALEQS